MKRSRQLVLALLLPLVLVSYSQDKYEREHRIKKNQFPTVARNFIDKNIKDYRKIKYYRETDSAEIRYTARFKVDRLRYGVSFNQQGNVHGIEIQIKEVDIPDESLSQILQFLDSTFNNYRMRRIQQLYPVKQGEPVAIILKNAFQNLLIPSLQYKMTIAGKRSKGFKDYEVFFDAEGQFLKLKESLPANYDHVLY
ncbi:MAG: hypothetical protein ABF295_09270 [Flavobacteriaceae bacterium]